MSLFWDLLAYASVIVGQDLAHGEQHHNALVRLSAQHEVLLPMGVRTNAHFLHDALIAKPLDWPPANDRDLFGCTYDQARIRARHSSQAYYYLLQHKGVLAAPPQLIDQLMREAWSRHLAWSALEDALDDAPSYYVRRSLDKLRSLLGPDAYYGFEMPAHLPPGFDFPPHYEWVPNPPEGKP